ncbi:MAG: type II toxin-antitoxin system PemK/MazF family toxin [Deltaproteobacteria bacterium]|nr:type II toxin-antitoxin system PemK/MazF family toxin [Deltaproteobacteria bacterium]
MVASRSPERGEVFLVALDPSRGSESRKTRPCVVVSPDELNGSLRTSPTRRVNPVRSK